MSCWHQVHFERPFRLTLEVCAASREDAVWDAVRQYYWVTHKNLGQFRYWFEQRRLDEHRTLLVEVIERRLLEFGVLQ